MSLKSISVSVVQAGLHQWPRAPEEVEFLRHPHRHLFTFSADLEVEDSDREVEFFTLQNAIKSYLMETFKTYRGHIDLLDFGNSSCEMLAEGLAYYLQGLELVVVGVTVSEDDENSGCYIIGADI